MPQEYDALLVASFGGPNGPDDVMPFLENVLRGRNTPRRRMLEVAEHYRHFGGVSPINAHVRDLTAALQRELDSHRREMRVYWGNRHWHPLMRETVRRMADEGIRRALALLPSPYGSPVSCRQYLEGIEAACEAVGPSAPRIEKLRAYFNHPGFIEPLVQRVRSALAQVPARRRATAHLLYTAHSIPLAMAAGCPYESQLREAIRLVGESLGREDGRMVFQSRSGPPQQPWLTPDLGAVLREIADQGEATDVVVAPVGFLSDHMEVVYDLDVEAKQLCDRLGLTMMRAGTVGVDPRFVRMVVELIEERRSESPTRLALGRMGPGPDACPSDCCRYESRRPPVR